MRSHSRHRLVERLGSRVDSEIAKSRTGISAAIDSIAHEVEGQLTQRGARLQREGTLAGSCLDLDCGPNACRAQDKLHDISQKVADLMGMVGNSLQQRSGVSGSMDVDPPTHGRHFDAGSRRCSGIAREHRTGSDVLSVVLVFSPIEVAEAMTHLPNLGSCSASTRLPKLGREPGLA